MEVGIVQGGVRARVVERQIVRHLTHLIPYLTPSPVTTLIHPFLRYAFLQPDPLTLHTPFSPVPPLSLPLHRPPLPLPPLTLTSPAPLASSFSRQPPLRRRLQSFRLPTPYKRSCCPFITTTPATTTTERPPPLSSPRSLSSFTVFHRSSLLLAFYHLRRAPPAYFLRFFVLFSSTAAILINALTLPLHNYACPFPDSSGSNNTISRVYRELLILGAMSPYSASLRSIRLDLTTIERLPKQAAVN